MRTRKRPGSLSRRDGPPRYRGLCTQTRNAPDASSLDPLASRGSVGLVCRVGCAQGLACEGGCAPLVLLFLWPWDLCQQPLPPPFGAAGVFWLPLSPSNPKGAGGGGGDVFEAEVVLVFSLWYWTSPNPPPLKVRPPEK